MIEQLSTGPVLISWQNLSAAAVIAFYANASRLAFNATEAGFAPESVLPFLQGDFAGAYASPAAADPFFTLLNGAASGSSGSNLTQTIANISSGTVSASWHSFKRTRRKRDIQYRNAAVPPAATCQRSFYPGFVDLASALLAFAAGAAAHSVHRLRRRWRTGRALRRVGSSHIPAGPSPDYHIRRAHGTSPAQL